MRVPERRFDSSIVREIEEIAERIGHDDAASLRKDLKLLAECTKEIAQQTIDHHQSLREQIQVLQEKLQSG